MLPLSTHAIRANLQQTKPTKNFRGMIYTIFLFGFFTNPFSDTLSI